MEVWALEAYCAAYTLQEMLTCEAVDVGGSDESPMSSIVRGRRQVRGRYFRKLQVPGQRDRLAGS